MIKYAGRSLKSQKWRSFLTILGVLIGIAAIVALTSLGSGFEQTITGQLRSGLATNSLYVSKSTGFDQADPDFSLYINDTSTINSIEHVEYAIPIIQKLCEVNHDNYSYRLSVYGVPFNNYSNAFDSFSAVKGTIPSNKNSTKFVIGNKIYQPWNNDSILVDVGENLNISWLFPTTGSYNNTVAAILQEVGGFSGLGGPSDTGIYISIDLASNIFETEKVSSFIVILDDDSKEIIDQVSSEIEEVFFGQVSVIAATSILDTITTAFGTIQIFLGGIAGISLIVAGIGIMNIMIVSLMERTREIGIIKALGLKNRSILLIFLMETSLIGFIGSLAGIGVGYLFALLFGQIIGGFGGSVGGGNGGVGGFDNPFSSLGGISPILSPTLILQAVLYGVVIAVVFGLYPAWRAARLEPVNALRYE
jgi:putative ABC transport system permease protein